MVELLSLFILDIIVHKTIFLYLMDLILMEIGLLLSRRHLLRLEEDLIVLN